VAQSQRALQSSAFMLLALTFFYSRLTGLVTEDNCTWCAAGKYQTGSGPYLLRVSFFILRKDSIYILDISIFPSEFMVIQNYSLIEVIGAVSVANMF
jgi:hypothetical protein